MHIGDFRRQCRPNITALVASEGATWKDVVCTISYLRDIDHDYKDSSEERTASYREQQMEILPASTGIQAKLCRPELLVETDAIAIFHNTSVVQ